MQRYYWFTLLIIASLVLLVSVYLLKENMIAAMIQKKVPTSSVFYSKISHTRELVFIANSQIQLDLDMTADSMDIAFHKFVSKRHYACENSIRLGNVLDGGWDMCLAEAFRPKHPCLVYSFGISNDFSFDDAVSSNFGCTVRSFDPSMDQDDYQRSASVWFYNLGISGEDVVNTNGWKLRTLSSIISLMKDSNKTLDYLKMDVEDSEWSSLTAILPSGILSKVKQLGIELHIGDWGKQSLYDKYRLLKGLEDQGFRRWYSVMNMYHIKETKNGFRSCCYEMVYINQNFLEQS